MGITEMLLRHCTAFLSIGSLALLPQLSANAATVTASACTSSAVQSAIDSANNGDTVVVPNGSCSWSSCVRINGKAIHLRGQSPTGVTITHNAGSSHLITVTESSAAPIHISDLNFVGGSGSEHTILMTASNNGRPI